MRFSSWFPMVVEDLFSLLDTAQCPLFAFNIVHDGAKFKKKTHGRHGLFLTHEKYTTISMANQLPDMQ
jgi:hypothetical protein